MKKLAEIIELINLNKIKSIEVIDHNTDSNTKLMQLYHGIRLGKFKDDDSAKNKLYPNSKSNNAYYKLKHTLRDRLYNTLFFLDVKSKKYSDIHKAKLYIQKVARIADILIHKGLKKNAIYISKKGLKLATEYEFTEEQLIFAQILRGYAASIVGDVTMFTTYNEIINECCDLQRSEMKVEGLMLNIIVLYVNDKSTKTFVYETANSYIEELAPFIPEKKQPKGNNIKL